MTLTQTSSPNFDARDQAVKLTYIVLHYTGMKTGKEALERLIDPAAKVSAHYVVEEDGRIFQLVDEKNRAWHAGRGSWKDVTDINSASIGIELVNPGHQHGYRAFPSAQITVLKELLRDIIARNNFDARTCLLGHSDIAPERKEDPGELFPWQELAKDGLGVWPQPNESDYADADDGEVQKLLRQIGYACPTTGAYDRETRAALIAFQRRYEPETLTGTPERETVGRMRALCRAKNG
ncbi:MAG TPA: N-acetylmuramoyl-L-alanine amidase [Alphaproteobacteria bacterium]|nr:N-acetylmuramoyl-L-alanine amidase [Alphaproteobacteria bacterium]